jgi:hypothetical protein
VQQPRTIPLLLSQEQTRTLTELRIVDFLEEKYEIPTNEMRERYWLQVAEQRQQFLEQKREYQYRTKELFINGNRDQIESIKKPLAPPPLVVSDRLEWFTPIPAAMPAITSDNCRIFKYLYEQGLYITNGSKFGGDYLVYRDDPDNCHSHYIINIIDKRDKLPVDQIISHCRLGKQTNKIKVFCYWDDGFHSISLDWTGWV